MDLNLSATKVVEVVYPTRQTRTLRAPVIDPNASYEMEGSEFDFVVYTADANFQITGSTPVASGTNGAGNGTAPISFTTITYTRKDAYANGQIVSGTASSQTYYYVIKELNPSDIGASGITVDGKEIRVTVTVTDDGYGNMTVTPVYTDNNDATAGDAEKTFVNTYTVKDTVTVNLTAVKTLIGKEMEAFTFQLKDATGAVVNTKQNVDSEGKPTDTVAFDALSFNQPGTYTYTVNEVPNTSGTKGTMTYDSTVYTVTIKVYDDRQGELYTEITINNGTSDVDLMEFVNHYKHPALTIDLSAQIDAHKQMVGPNGEDLSYLLKQHTFKFEVKDILGNFVLNGQGTSDADGNISFPEFTFTAAGEYHYLISEVHNDADNGVTSDPQVWCVHIKVVYNRNTGLLEIDPNGCTTHPYNATTHNEDGISAQSYQNPVFVNKYDAGDVSLTLTAKKVLDGRDLKDHEFTFRLLNADGTIAAEARNHADGSITFLLDYELADLGGAASKAFTYKMVEVIPDTKLGGVTYSQQSSTVTVTVTDSQTGKLVVNVGTDGVDYANKTYNTGIQFTNSYAAAEVQVQIDALKRMNGTKPLGADEYTFRLVGAGVDLTAKNDADGKITFDALTFEQPGTYIYTMTEVGTTVIGGVTYDQTEYTVTVTVTDDLVGKLHAAVEYADEDGNIYAVPVFTNTYLADGAVATVEADKSLTGKTMAAGEFTFKLFDAEGNEVASVTNDAQGNVVFPQMVFASTGVYTYTISEVKGSNAGMTYDDTVYTVTVTVTDENYDGELDATVAYTKDGTAVSGVPVFKNTYKAASVDVQVSAEKELTGKTMAAEEFTFSLVGNGVNLTAKNDAQGKIDFSKITITAADMVDDQGNPVVIKNFQYTLSEVKGENPGMAYDTDQYIVSVTVTDDGQGHLTATVDYTLNEVTVEAPVFHNSYVAGSVNVSLEAQKILQGKELTAGAFNFQLKAEDGTVLDTVTNNADGKIIFKPITYTTAKVYTYTLSEVKGDAKGMTYDATVYTITVTVSDDGNGQLVAKTEYKADGKTVEALTFTNTYKGLSTTADIQAKKVLEGKDLAAGAYSFKLVNKDNANESYTVTNGADGSILFEDLAFTEPGVYTYLLSEVKGTDAKTAYDDTVYTVTVTVTDDLKGNLVAEVSYGQQTMVFTNVYTPDPVSVSLQGTKELTGRAQVAGEFTFEVRDANGKLIATGTNTADGTIKFEAITVYGAGEAVLYITEVEGSDERMTYDDYTYRVKLVAANDNGKLVATVTYLDGDIVFYNEALDNDVPLTGDDTPIGLYAGLLGTSMLALCAILILGRKKETV